MKDNLNICNSNEVLCSATSPSREPLFYLSPNYRNCIIEAFNHINLSTPVIVELHFIGSKFFSTRDFFAVLNFEQEIFPVLSNKNIGTSFPNHRQNRYGTAHFSKAFCNLFLVCVYSFWHGLVLVGSGSMNGRL